MLSLLGDDPDSDWATALLAERRVELVAGSRRAGARLSRCIILVEAHGARTIINEPLQVPPLDLESWLANAVVARRHVLHLQGDQIASLARLLPQARQRGLLLATHTTHLATEWRSPSALTRLCQLFDIVILNREIAGESTGSRGGTAELVRDLQPFADSSAEEFLLVLTLGAEGALLLRRHERPLHEPAPSAHPVDTTGAGDTFAGCFLAMWASGEEPAVALCLAVHGASRSIESPGAQEHGLRAADFPPPGSVPPSDGQGSFERFSQPR